MYVEMSVSAHRHAHQSLYRAALSAALFMASPNKYAEATEHKHYRRRMFNNRPFMFELKIFNQPAKATFQLDREQASLGEYFYRSFLQLSVTIDDFPLFAFINRLRPLAVMNNGLHHFDSSLILRHYRKCLELVFLEANIIMSSKRYWRLK